MRPLWSLWAIVLLGCITACSDSIATTHNPYTVSMVQSAFTSRSIHVPVGSSIAFLNTSDTAALHILAIGTNGDAHAEAGAPSFGGTSGIRVNQGDIWNSPVWSAPGTYYVTCTVHPSMNITVVVVPKTSGTATP